MVSKSYPIIAKYQKDNKNSSLTYWDTDTFDDLDLNLVRQIYGVCFIGGKIVIVKNGKNNTWGLVGGTRDEGESIDQTFVREVQEESNMRVLSWQPLGIQQVDDYEAKRYFQLRVVAHVEPIGEFQSDPAGAISEVSLIYPNEYKQYFDWGEIGDAIMKRALEKII